MPNETTRQQDICDKKQLIFVFTLPMSLDICSALYFIYVSLCSGLLVRNKTTSQQQQQKQKDKQSKKIEKKGFDI